MVAQLAKLLASPGIENGIWFEAIPWERFRNKFPISTIRKTKPCLHFNSNFNFNFLTRVGAAATFGSNKKFEFRDWPERKGRSLWGKKRWNPVLQQSRLRSRREQYSAGCLYDGEGKRMVWPVNLVGDKGDRAAWVDQQSNVAGCSRVTNRLPSTSAA